MSRLCWVFVLLLDVLVAAVPSDARTCKCEQIERSLADLDLAESVLNRTKQLYPNCGGKEEDKLRGFLDVALDQISNAKKIIPHCPVVPTEEPLTTPGVTTENFRPTDCQDVLAAGNVTTGVYFVWPRGGKSPVLVRCDMDTVGGGWTVIQRRGKFSPQENFDRDWQDYKNGFGSRERDFWLGNDAIFALTNQGKYSLRMDMTAADGASAYALFREFRIEDGKANYKLHVDGYEGNAGDCMTAYSNNEMFWTKDRKNVNIPSKNFASCAAVRKSGWWFSMICSWCNPNGLYKPGEKTADSMFYSHFKDMVGLSSFDMKIKRLF